MFFVIAYRWGWKNGHQYVVDCSSNLQGMIDKAESECADRGGKYGVVVYRVNHEDANHVIEKYFPSLCGEEIPYMNEMIEVHKDIGRAVVEVSMVGSVHLPDPNGNSTYLINTKVEIPEWLKDEVNRKTKYYEAVYKNS